ncbi:MAG: protein translocase subunit SecD [Candidatus Dependentiae bacterium]|nr:protein translocase subunit SecD [Candidatus Dependentiae bacterium]
MNSSLQRTVFSWFSFWIVVAIASVIMLWPLREKLRFGIDLVGGTYIMLQVQTEKAIEAELQSRSAAIVNLLEKAHLSSPNNSIVSGTTISLTFDSVNNAQAASSLLSKEWPDMAHSSEGTTVRFTLNKAAEKAITSDAVSRNIEVLRSRLDQLSVSEISIAAHGDKDIVIELPDVKDPQQAKAMIGKAAVLEFRLVKAAGRSPEDIIYDLGGDLPYNLEILPGKDNNKRNQEYYAVSRNAELTGSALRTARAQIGDKGQMVVGFEFTPEAGEIFGDVTGRNIGKRLAIVLDGIVISAPVIQSRINDKGQITGSENADEAKELALLLRSGAFVAPVTFEEERQIGPSLGAQAIRQGLIACLVGLALLFVFSVIYYKFAGLLAFIALLFNVLLVLVGLHLLHATLTLPGIAGIVLTLGMAIDSSILIYERIKEELAGHASLRQAVKSGFSDAMVVILDANITTFIVGIVLYWFGTGPVQGFAITMMLGIIATLLTGLFFLKSLFSFILDNFSLQKLRI